MGIIGTLIGTVIAMNINKQSQRQAVARTENHFRSGVDAQPSALCCEKQ